MQLLGDIRLRNHCGLFSYAFVRMLELTAWVALPLFLDFFWNFFWNASWVGDKETDCLCVIFCDGTINNMWNLIVSRSRASTSKHWMFYDYLAFLAKYTSITAPVLNSGVDQTASQHFMKRSVLGE